MYFTFDEMRAKSHLTIYFLIFPPFPFPTLHFPRHIHVVALINEKVYHSYHTEEEAYAEGLLKQMRAIEDMTKKKPTNLLQLKHDSILELCRYLKDDLTNYKARFEYLSSQCTELFNIRGITYKVLETSSLHGQEMNESIFRTRVRNFQDAFQLQLLDDEEDLEESNDEDDDDDDDDDEVDEDDDDDDDDDGEEEEEEEDIEQEEDGVDADEGENGHEHEKQEADDDDIDEVEELEEDETMEAEDAAPEANDCGSEVDSEDGQLGEKRSRSQSQCDDDDEEEDEIEEDDVDEDELEEEEDDEEESSNKKQRITA
jgi:hypothetical protein